MSLGESEAVPCNTSYTRMEETWPAVNPLGSIIFSGVIRAETDRAAVWAGGEAPLGAFVCVAGGPDSQDTGLSFRRGTKDPLSVPGFHGTENVTVSYKWLSFAGRIDRPKRVDTALTPSRFL